MRFIDTSNCRTANDLYVFFFHVNERYSLASPLPAPKQFSYIPNRHLRRAVITRMQIQRNMQYLAH